MEVVVNVAMSADGKLSTREREQVAISDAADFDRVDAMRAASDAVMVGVGTVLADDPSLTVDDPDRREQRRSRGDPAQPARVVADSQMRTPEDATVLDDAAHTYILTSRAARPAFVEAMEAAGATVIATGERRVDLVTGLAKLEGDGVDQLMVEGGGELIFSLFEAELVDTLWTYVGPTIIGGRDAPTVADGEGFLSSFPALELATVESRGAGALLEWTVES